ncbi:MAG: uroporphyrinogen-III synthase [Alphaproteobacteria bacterium]|nr:uroporphyrinogen-III synthase [Alphaproteobacteria bacterium]
MKVIITRPIEDAGALSEKLLALGHMPIVVPLMTIVARLGVVIPQRPYQAICLTSANAIRVLSDVTGIATVPLYAVGPQSLRMAKEKGFKLVEAQGGDVIRLHSFLVDALRLKDGPLLYLSGSETSGDLHGRLHRSGFDVDRVITYDALPAQLNRQQAAQIREAEAVVLYSPRSAKLWVQQIEANKMNTQASRVLHVCLSASVAANLPQSWPRAVAEQANELAMLALLDRAAKAE